MTSSPSEDLNDKELADLMADPELEDASDGLSDDDAGVVEGGIPPEISNDQSVDSSEQSFSVDDFGDSGEDGSVSAPPSTAPSASVPDEPSSPAQDGQVASSAPPLMVLPPMAGATMERSPSFVGPWPVFLVSSS